MAASREKCYILSRSRANRLAALKTVPRSHGRAD